MQQGMDDGGDIAACCGFRCGWSPSCCAKPARWPWRCWCQAALAMAGILLVFVAGLVTRASGGWNTCRRLINSVAAQPELQIDTALADRVLLSRWRLS